jgi:hypothetical protein
VGSFHKAQASALWGSFFPHPFPSVFLMAFLRNDAVNRVNLHSGIQALAQGAGGIFFLVFFLRAGISVPAALGAQAAILAGRFMLRPTILPLAKRCGLKPLLIFGTLATSVQYPLLPELDGVGGALLVLCIVTSVGEVCYWLSYNAISRPSGMPSTVATSWAFAKQWWPSRASSLRSWARGGF